MVHTGKALPVSQIIPRGTASGACFHIKQPNWSSYSLTGHEAVDSRKVKRLVKTVLFCFFLESRQLTSISSFIFLLFFSSSSSFLVKCWQTSWLKRQTSLSSLQTLEMKKSAWLSLSGLSWMKNRVFFRRKGLV